MLQVGFGVAVFLPVLRGFGVIVVHIVTWVWQLRVLLDFVFCVGACVLSCLCLCLCLFGLDCSWRCCVVSGCYLYAWWSVDCVCFGYFVGGCLSCGFMLIVLVWLASLV